MNKIEEMNIPFDRLYGLNLRDAPNRIKQDEVQGGVNYYPTDDGEMKQVKADSAYASDAITFTNPRAAIGFLETISGVVRDVVLAHGLTGSAAEVYTAVDTATPAISTIDQSAVTARWPHDSCMARIDKHVIFTSDNATRLLNTASTYANRLFRLKAAPTSTSIFDVETLSISAPNFTPGQLAVATTAGASNKVFGTVRYQAAMIRKESGVVTKIGPPMTTYKEVITGVTESTASKVLVSMSGFAVHSDVNVQGYTHMRFYRTLNLDATAETSGGAGSPLVFRDMSTFISDVATASIAAYILSDNTSDLSLSAVTEILETQGTSVIPACRGCIAAGGRMFYWGDPNNPTRLYNTKADTGPSMRGLYATTGRAFLHGVVNSETGETRDIDIGGFQEIDPGDGMPLLACYVEGENLLICKEGKTYILQDMDPTRDPLPVSTAIGVPGQHLRIERQGAGYYFTNQGLRRFEGDRWGEKDLTEAIWPLYNHYINFYPAAGGDYPAGYSLWAVYDKSTDMAVIAGGPGYTGQDFTEWVRGATTLSSLKLGLGIKFLQDDSAHPFLYQNTASGTRQWRFLTTMPRSQKNIGIYNDGGTGAWNKLFGASTFLAGSLILKTISAEGVNRVFDPYLLGLEAVTGAIFTINQYANNNTTVTDSRTIDPSNPDDMVWNRR